MLLLQPRPPVQRMDAAAKSKHRWNQSINQDRLKKSKPCFQVRPQINRIFLAPAALCSAHKGRPKRAERQFVFLGALSLRLFYIASNWRSFFPSPLLFSFALIFCNGGCHICRNLFWPRPKELVHLQEAPRAACPVCTGGSWRFLLLCLRIWNDKGGSDGASATGGQFVHVKRWELSLVPATRFRSSDAH